MSDHLKFDTDFLDKDLPKKTGIASSADFLLAKKYNWKKILIISGVVLFFGWAIFSGSGDSTSNSTYTSTTSSNDTQLFSEDGKTFSCTNSNYDKALQLKPNTSTNIQLSTELDSLNARIDANKADEDQIDAMHVDESDQYAIDNYNSRVEDYNTERESLLSDLTNWKQRHDVFSSQVDAYNNFLDTNCTQ